MLYIINLLPHNEIKVPEQIRMIQEKSGRKVQTLGLDDIDIHHIYVGKSISFVTRQTHMYTDSRYKFVEFKEYIF